MKKPSVTQLLSLLDKPGLLKWSNKIGLEGIKLDEYRKSSASAGTSLHKQIEEFNLINKPFENQYHQDRFEELASDKKFIDFEQNIDNEWFSGRYDCKLEHNGCLYICDFKSSTKIYFENKLQLTCYKMANPECKIAVIQIPEFIFKPIDIDFKKYETIIKCLSKIWQLKKELGE
jgi:hypothetical protein